jgi:hypothetical protein
MRTTVSWPLASSVGGSGLPHQGARTAWIAAPRPTTSGISLGGLGRRGFYRRTRRVEDSTEDLFLAGGVDTSSVLLKITGRTAARRASSVPVGISVDRVGVTFGDERLVANAGLAPASLAQHLPLPEGAFRG